MSKDPKAPAIPNEDFVIASVGGRYVRFRSVEDVPKGEPGSTGPTPVTLDTVRDLSNEEIGKLYATLAGTSPKNFKDRDVAVSSVAYQVKKMPYYDPDAPQKSAAAPAKGSGHKKSANGTDEPKVRKGLGSYELLQPENVDEVVRSLAPQAQNLVLIMAEAAKGIGSTKIPGDVLLAKLKEPKSVEMLKTTQEPQRIFMYYKSALKTKGLIKSI